MADDAKGPSQEARKLAEDIAEHQDVDRCVGPCPGLALLLDSALRAVETRLRDDCKVTHTVERQRANALQMELDAICRENGRLETAMRAVEKRMLERAAKLMCGQCAQDRPFDADGVDHLFEDVPCCQHRVGCLARPIRSEIASLQAREAPRVDKYGRTVAVGKPFGSPCSGHEPGDVCEVCAVTWPPTESQAREACPPEPHVHEVFRSGVKEGGIPCNGQREAPKPEEPKPKKLRHGPLCRYEEIGQCECEPQPEPVRSPGAARGRKGANLALEGLAAQLFLRDGGHWWWHLLNDQVREQYRKKATTAVALGVVAWSKNTGLPEPVAAAPPEEGR